MCSRHVDMLLLRLQPTPACLARAKSGETDMCSYHEAIGRSSCGELDSRQEVDWEADETCLLQT